MSASSAIQISKKKQIQSHLAIDPAREEVWIVGDDDCYNLPRLSL